MFWTPPRRGRCPRKVRSRVRAGRLCHRAGGARGVEFLALFGPRKVTGTPPSPGPGTGGTPACGRGPATLPSFAVIVARAGCDWLPARSQGAPDPANATPGISPMLVKNGCSPARDPPAGTGQRRPRTWIPVARAASRRGRRSGGGYSADLLPAAGGIPIPDGLLRPFTVTSTGIAWVGAAPDRDPRRLEGAEPGRIFGPCRVSPSAHPPHSLLARGSS